MSRIAKSPVTIPAGVDVKVEGNSLSVKGIKALLTYDLNPLVNVEITDKTLSMQWNKDDKDATAQAGTARALIQNMMIGASVGFEKKMTLIGVGYRAQAKDRILNLALGFSHPVDFQIPEGITIETPTQTEVIIKGSDKQLVGEVAAKIRAYRPPEPYKGKGIRYTDEFVPKKEAKKK